MSRFSFVAALLLVLGLPAWSRPAPLHAPDEPLIAGAPEWRDHLVGELVAFIRPLGTGTIAGDPAFVEAMRAAVLALERREHDRALAHATAASAVDPTRWEPYVVAAVTNVSLGLFSRAFALIDAAYAYPENRDDEVLSSLGRVIAEERRYWGLIADAAADLRKGDLYHAFGPVHEAWRLIPRREGLGVLGAYLAVHVGRGMVDELADSLDRSGNGMVRQLVANARAIDARPRDRATDSMLTIQIAQIVDALRLDDVWPISDAAVQSTPAIAIDERATTAHRVWNGEVSLRAEYTPINVDGNWTSFASLGAAASAVVWLDESFNNGVEFHVPVHIMFTRDLADDDGGGSLLIPAARSSVRPEIRFWTGPFGLSLFAEHAYYASDFGSGLRPAEVATTSTHAGAGASFAVGGGQRRQWRVLVHVGLGFLGASTAYESGISAAYESIVLDIEHASFTGRTHFYAHELPVSMVRVSLGWRGFPFQ